VGARLVGIEAAAQRLLAELIVSLALFGIGEDVVGDRDLLELLLGGLVARIDVRVMLARQLAVRLADLVRRRGPRHAQRLVGILRHGERLVTTDDGRVNARRYTSGMLRTVLLLIGAVASGELKAEIREYDVPTPGSRPHDPAVAPDGALWYTGQQ